MLQVVPLDFDVAALEIWGTLLNGASLVIAPPGRPDPLELGRLIAERGVTFTAASTGLFHELVRAALPDLAGLRLATPGGDVLSPEAVRALHDAHPHVRVVNGWGPTEVTIVACSHEVGEPDGSPVPIGRPLPGCEVYVFDEEGRPVADGEAGELWVGGFGVSRGYRGDPDRTAERFHANPFGPGTIYRTGDRGRWREDGELLFLGRMDRQVKISGQRVELGEVEHALAEHPGIQAAAVTAAESVAGHKRLVAHVVPVTAPGPGSAELRTFVADRLPRFMVPSTFLMRDALPLTDRGKVDHAELKRASEVRRSGNAGVAGATVEVVRSLMAGLLELDSVGPDENLFDIGGDSLLAIALLGLLREQLGVELSIDTVFEWPTAAALADIIELAPRSSDRPRLAAGPGGETAPLSCAQRRAWLFTRMNPGSIAYQVAALLRFKGDLDRDAMAGALEELIRRHEILRTSFVQKEDEPVQVVQQDFRLPLEELDLRGAGHAAAGRLIRDRVRRVVDPGRPRWSAGRWLASATTSGRWSTSSTISCTTAGRSRSWSASSPSSIRHESKAARPPCPARRSSSGTTPAGSGSWWRAIGWPSRSPIGSGPWTATHS